MDSKAIVVASLVVGYKTANFRFNLMAIVMEKKMGSYRLMFGPAVGTFVKSLVELIPTVIASDFDDDFLFHYFLSD